jgi:oxygen-dependent protoporphyrinogen oxidase
MSNLIVIGGGISGLTAAYLACQQGARVQVIEPGPLGGVIRTHRVGGFTLEHGPNVLIEKPDFARFIDMLGFRDEMVYPAAEPYRQFVWHAGRAREVPKSLPAFVCSDLFTLREKGSVLRTLFSSTALSSQEEDSSVLDYFSKGLGSSVTRRVLDPVLKGIYGGDLSRLSARALFPNLWQATKEKKSLVSFMRQRARQRTGPLRTFVFRRGMSSFVQHIVQCAGPALSVIQDAAVHMSFVQGEHCVTLASGGKLKSSRVVVATPHRVLAGMIADDNSEPAQQFISAVKVRRYAPLTFVHVASSQFPTYPEDSFGVLFPEGTEYRFLGAMFNSALFPHLAPQGQHLITLCFGGIEALEDPSVLNPSQQVVAKVCGRYLGLTHLTTLSQHVWNEAIPQYEIGSHLIEAALKRFEGERPGLISVSVDSGGVGVPDRVRFVMERLL